MDQQHAVQAALALRQKVSHPPITGSSLPLPWSPDRQPASSRRGRLLMTGRDPSLEATC